MVDWFRPVHHPLLERNEMKSRTSAILLLLSLVILTPLILPLKQPGTLHEFDMILHLQRIVAFYHSIQEHIIPPTWSTYLSYGFGSPVLLYNWSFPYYVAVVPLALGSTLIDAYKWSEALSYVLAFIFMYVFISSWTKSKIAGIVAAAWYVWAPYRFNIHELRGAIGEEFSTAFWPGIFWATFLINKKRYMLGFLLGALFWSLVLWSHQSMFGMIAPLWVIFCVIEVLRTNNTRAFVYSVGALIFGMCIVAFTFVPIIFERGFLLYQLHEAVYTTNFVRWTQLLAAPGIQEFGLQNGPTRYLVFYSIGWPIIVVGLLTLIGLIASIRNSWTTRRSYQAIFLCMGIFAVFLMRPASVFLWAHVPMLAPTIDFPQRFLGLTMFCGSVLAGLWVSNTPKRYVWTTSALFVAAIVFTGIPHLTLNPHYEPDLNILNHPVLTTTDVWGEFSPNGMPDDFRQNGDIYALQPMITVVPQPSTKSVCIQTSIRITCHVNTEGPSKIRVRQFDFPGWEAYADAIRVPIVRQPDGTIGLSVPKPIQTVELRFTGTLLDNAARYISILGIIVYLSLVIKTFYTGLKKKK